VEEWNEYGELKEHVGPGAMAPGTASSSTAPSTPSKAPPSIETPTKIRFTAETPTKASQSAATSSPMTIAMRQAGLEAAKKACDAKSQARAKVFGASESSNDAVKKLDNSTTSGIPPPSGTTEAASPVPPETGPTAAKPTAEHVGANSKSLAEPAKGPGLAGKGNSDTESIAESGSEVLSDGDEVESPDQDNPATTQFEPRNGSSGEEDRDSEISASGKVTNKEKPKIEDQDLAKAAGELGITGGSLLDHTKLETKSTTDADQDVKV
jgi:hypothetical protein